MTETTGRKIIRINAPMLGIVVDMNPLLKHGLYVEKGDELLTMERMKLFCTISAPYAGVITALMVNSGDRVAQGGILLEMEVRGDGYGHG